MTNDKTQIAKTVGKITIAEYVLNEDTMTLLKELGIDYAQGHYIGMPQQKIT